MLKLFTNNLLPIFLAAGAGYAIAWRTRMDPRPVAQLAFYVFAPCLVFQIVLEAELSGSAFLRMIAFTALSLLALAGLAVAIGRALGWSRPLVAAVTLVVLLPNAGNYGLSANLFAFGESGLAGASVYFLTSSVLTFTVGVFVASLGQKTISETLAALVRIPAIWAVVLAALLVVTDSRPPVPVARTVKLLSEASIPTFLVVLGMQLYGRGVRGPAGPLTLACGARLLGGALVGLVLANGLGLHDAARQAAVLQSAMPSAVITIVLATEYDLEPAFVTSAVVLTTVLSPLTLTPLLAYLGA